MTMSLFKFTMLWGLLVLILSSSILVLEIKDREMQQEELIKLETEYKISRDNGEYLVKCFNGSLDVLNENMETQIICGKLIRKEDLKENSYKY